MRFLCLSVYHLICILISIFLSLGNATVNGAFANVVCAGIAEQNGYKISFKYFAKYV